MDKELKQLYIYMLKWETNIISVTKEREDYIIKLETRRYLLSKFYAFYNPKWQKEIRLTPAGR
ncbi:hypothetical protein LCGC14_1536000 [marine sediment metagenome]|uniref:Homing endonuclease LAGLIDADG domain-containing protein n=1 Tax=marine sediment metagenome TaxID=412755 RepID=A0A0F9LA81_9ZZZZ